MGNNYRTIMRTAVFTSLLVVGLAGYAMAQTPDGQTPAEETVCDGLEGALFGLCNAYCEALDCDEDILANITPSRQCGRVLKNFVKKSGGPRPPCFPEKCAVAFPQCDGRCPAKAPVCFNIGGKVGCRCLEEIPTCGNRFDPLCNGECTKPNTVCTLSGFGRCGCAAVCDALTQPKTCGFGVCPEDLVCSFDDRKNVCGCIEPEVGDCPCGSTKDLLALGGVCIRDTGSDLQILHIQGYILARATPTGSSCDFGAPLFKLPTDDAEAKVCIDNILATGLPPCEEVPEL